MGESMINRRPASLQPDPDSLARRGRTFEENVTDLLRLMDYEVEWNTLSDGRQVDFIARKRDPLGEVCYVGECKDHRRPSGVDDLDPLHSRLASFRKKELDSAQGLLVTRAGFTAEAKAQAPGIGITLRTYDDLLNGLVDLRAYQAGLIQDVEGTDIERLYIEPDLWPEEDPKPRPLAGYIEKWLADSEATHLTLLGDYGTGKTWFTRKLAFDLARRYRQDPSRNRQPIRINLRDVAKAFTLENLLFDHFQSQTGRPINPKSILHLLAAGQLVLILDGFNEMATQSSWEDTLGNFRQLARAAEGDAKVILTCRTHYFKDESQMRELLEGGKPQLSAEGTLLYREVFGRKGFRVGYLSDFTPEQVQEYLRRAGGERAGEIGRLVENTPSLKQIAGRPVLLDMIVQSAPKLASLDRPVKVAHLYEVYTEEWFRRQDWRLRLTLEGRTALVQELAVKLWETEGARIHYRELADVLAGLMRDRITTERELEMADYEVRTASFLTRDGAGHYGFSHRSFLEFFLAARLARVLQEAGDDYARLAEALRLRPLSKEVLEFLRDLAGTETLARVAAEVLKRPHAARSSENALLLAAWSGKCAHGARLEGAQLAGFPLAGCDLTGANLTKANLAGVQLAGAVLDGALMDEADLTRAEAVQAHAEGARLRRAKLACADWTDAILSGADFSDADLSFAQLARARLDGAVWEAANCFGAGFRGATAPPPAADGVTAAVPLLQTGAGWAVLSVCYSTDGKLLAAVDGSMVRIYDTVLGLCRRVLAGHGGQVAYVAWSSDGVQLASGSDDQTVRIWEAASGKLLRTLEGHEDSVTSVAWRGDGVQLASGSDDKTVRIWEPRASCSGLWRATKAGLRRWPGAATGSSWRAAQRTKRCGFGRRHPASCSGP